MKVDLNESNTKKHTRPGGRELAGRKIIKCPYCRELLMDVDRYTKVEIFTIPAHKPKMVRYERTKPCPACGGRVGYNLK